LQRATPRSAQAQRLRYDVFIEELGGDGTLVDHDARIEADRFDPFFDHLLLRDRRRAAGRTSSASTA
jgi:putative hemolysin